MKAKMLSAHRWLRTSFLDTSHHCTLSYPLVRLRAILCTPELLPLSKMEVEGSTLESSHHLPPHHSISTNTAMAVYKESDWTVMQTSPLTVMQRNMQDIQQPATFHRANDYSSVCTVLNHLWERLPEGSMKLWESNEQISAVTQDRGWNKIFYNSLFPQIWGN